MISISVIKLKQTKRIVKINLEENYLKLIDSTEAVYMYEIYRNNEWIEENTEEYVKLLNEKIDIGLQMKKLENADEDQEEKGI